MSTSGSVILVIDDSPGDVDSIKRALEAIPDFEFELLHARGFHEAQSHLARPGVDIVFLDYLLGRGTGEDVNRFLREIDETLPVIILTAFGDDAAGACLMNRGATDYVSKSSLDTDTLRRTIANAQAQQVRHDFELAHRRLLEDLQRTKSQLEAKNQRLSLLYSTAHEFVDHVAHEFRTPLTVVREFASLVGEGLMGTVNDEQKDALQLVVDRVDGLSALVDDMLDISKLEAGMLGISRKDCHIGDIIEQVRCSLERRAASARVDLRIDVLPDLPDVYCDAEKIGRVLINLVVNALKFSDEGGSVEITAQPRHEAHELVVSVKDTGPGIAKDDLEQLFGRFQQIGGDSRSGIKGFGLGLSIARELVHLNLGDIAVDSELGWGSSFSFTVPFSSRRELIQRYFSRIGHYRDDAHYVSLIELSADAAIESRGLAHLEQLIQHNIRRIDLFFAIKPHRWALVAVADRKNLEPMVERLRKVHETAVHRDSYQSLPDLRITTVGAWSLDTEEDQCIERILEVLQCEEMALA